MKNLVIYGVAFFWVNCAYEVRQPMALAVSKNQKQSIQVISDDRILVEILCDSIERSQIGKCVEETKQTSSAFTFDRKKVRVHAEITDSSSDYFQSMGKSLVTLTLGVFITNSAKIRFKIEIPNKEKDIYSSGRIGRWGILPFYAGLVATNFGTLLNTYRNPEHLQKYCLNEPISKLRKVLEAEKEDYCAEYIAYLKDSFYKVEKEFIETIKEEGKNEN